ncbi:MAG: hypothetical protein IKD90_11040 [Clostridiales bacterium]|jgi:hypothetical protein|nr:hypothetical protein [Clostridiales bacterium]
MSENEGKTRVPKEIRKIRVVGSVVSAVLLFSTVWFSLKTWKYMVPSFTIAMVLSALGFIISLIALIRVRTGSNMKTMYLVSLILLSLTLFVSSFSIPFSSTAKKNYTKQLAYLTRERYVPQFFPNAIPESTTDYRLDFCSEDFRSSSYVMLEFSCDEKDMSPFAKLAKSKSVLSAMSVEEATAADLDAKIKAEIAGFVGTEIEESYPIQLKISFPENIDEHPNAKVFILRCSNNIDDLTTEAIILDEENNWVCFSTII